MHGNVKAERVVLAHGCFDGLHIGHIRHLQEAKQQGDRLVVSVTDDVFVRKGLGRPRFTAKERLEAVQALECVDAAFISLFPTAIEIIATVKPEIYVKGVDYDGSNDPDLAAEIAAVERYGGKFHVTKSAKLSSSRLINAERHGEQVAAYLASARERGFLSKIKDAIAKADELNILFVGETILDEYIYVAPLGRPSKEFMLATVRKKAEAFLGGIVAAKEHCEWKGVRCITQINFPLKKTRYVDEDFTRKLFEVYSEQWVSLDEQMRATFSTALKERVPEMDAVVVMDFGHGLITDADRQFLEKSAKFLAVNAQTNAGNVGFNPVTLYNSADLVCVDEPEARFAANMPTHSVDVAMFWLMERVYAHNIVITRGKNGAVCCRRHEHPTVIPAFTVQITDTIGAGDAFLATAAPLVAAGLELEAAAFAGNVAGAIKTTIVGHRTHVTREDLLANIEALLA